MTNGNSDHRQPEHGPWLARPVNRPIFSEPEPTPDPQTFRIRHASDRASYNTIDELNREHKIHPLPFPAPRGGIEPILTLKRVLGDDEQAQAAVERILTRGQLVFHAGGDCGNTNGPEHQNEVTDKLLGDFHEVDAAEVPQFALLLGDIVYSFGEAKYYYDQFYEPYRDYPAPILAVAGNHDGMVAPDVHVASLDAYLRNFCSKEFVVAPEALTLSRTAQVQPGVFFTFEAPFVRILALYSNMLEDPGVIADQNIGTSQLQFLEAALERVKVENYQGALLFAHHHPPYTPSHGGSRHGGSPNMLAQMDSVCEKVGVWPHAVLCGHCHNMQRFTRYRGDTQIPYVTSGNMGHNVQRLSRKGAPTLRVPQILQEAGDGRDKVVFNRYDDLNYGYLRVIASEKQLRIEYHAISDGPHSKSPDDSVTIDLETRTMTTYDAPDLGQPAEAAKARALRGHRNVAVDPHNVV